jgi:hypothetical protein
MEIGMYPYLRSIIVTKETKPNQVSWLIWSCIGLTNLFTYVSAGAGESVWFALASAINTTAIFLLSLKYGEKKWSPTDIASLALASIGIIIWKISGSATLGLIASLTIEGLGTVPTAKKLWHDPWSENLTGWCIGLTASVLNIFAVEHWNLATIAFTTYNILGFGIIVVFIVRGNYLPRPAVAP